MRDFNYHKLAERTWDNEILSYLAQIHEHKSNNWMMHLQGILDKCQMRIRDQLVI